MFLWVTPADPHHVHEAVLSLLSGLNKKVCMKLGGESSGGVEEEFSGSEWEMALIQTQYMKV